MGKVLGLGRTLQGIILDIYRAGFEGRAVFAGGTDIDKLKARGLVEVRRRRVDLTAAGRTAVVRIAPLWFAILALALVGCGDEFGPDWSGCLGSSRVIERGALQPPPPDSAVVPLPTKTPTPRRPAQDAGTP